MPYLAIGDHIMKNTGCIYIFGICLTILLFTIDSTADPNLRYSFNSGSQEIIKQGVVDQDILIAPQLNKLNFGMGWSNDNSFYYEKSLSKIFFHDHIINVKITDIDFDKSNITLKLLHPVIGIGIITFVFNEDLISRESDKGIQQILLTTLGDANHQYVFVNPKSGRYHLYSCLHSERRDRLIRMSREDAEIRGYRPGGFCFNKVVYLPDLAIEKEIEIHWLTRLREHALFAGDARRQETVDRLGRHILDNWPFELLGYNYSFHVIDSRRITTVAIPAGKIFVTTALMDSLENEDEIEALLVRAIAHIEGRHSLKQYYKKSNAMKSKQFLQKLTMATGAFTGIFAGPGSGAIEALGNVPFQVSSKDQPLSSGFEDDFEGEADMVASLYFELQGKDKGHLSAAIRKLQLAALYFNVRQNESFNLVAAMNNLELNEMATQLYLSIWEKEKNSRFDERAKRSELTKFKYFKDDDSFIFQEDRRFPVQLDLKYQSIFKNENKLMVYLNDRSLLDNHDGNYYISKVTLLIRDKHGKHRFKLLSKYTTADMWGMRMTFEAAGKQPDRFLEEIQDLKIETVERGRPPDKTSDIDIEHYAFVKGRLESENRIAHRLQPGS
jgi:hypothetical protein